MTNTSTASSNVAKRQIRRSNVERSATTQSKVIAAAIQCLKQYGYHGTSVIQVAKLAGVSRGAAQHQFPSKVDLMLAVAQHIVDSQAQRLTGANASGPLAENVISKGFDISWESNRKPERLALLEIMLATRSDDELRERFKPCLKHIAYLREVVSENMAELFGVPNQPKIKAFVRLHNATMRSLALELAVCEDPENVEEAVELFKEYEILFRQHLQRLYAKESVDA